MPSSVESWHWNVIVTDLYVTAVTLWTWNMKELISIKLSFNKVIIKLLPPSQLAISSKRKVLYVLVSYQMLTLTSLISRIYLATVAIFSEIGFSSFFFQLEKQNATEENKTKQVQMFKEESIPKSHSQGIISLSCKTPWWHILSYDFIFKSQLVSDWWKATFLFLLLFFNFATYWEDFPMPGYKSPFF